MHVPHVNPEPMHALPVPPVDLCDFPVQKRRDALGQ